MREPEFAQPDLDAEPRIEPPVAGYRITLLALAFAGGITIGWLAAEPHVWPWLMAASAALLLGIVALGLWPPASTALLLASACAFGAAWVTITHDYSDADNLAAFVGDEQMLVRVRGVAEGAPVLRERTTGSMARFDYREPATYFPMRVEALLDRDGRAAPIHGKLLVRIDESVAPFRAGDHLETMGFVLRPAGPRNPGEFDYRRYARSLGQAGVLTVPGRELLTVMPAERGTIRSTFLNWRDELRRRASAWLLADLPESGRTERDALLVSLLLGQREAQIDGFYESFQRVGLAHILAISGFHLSVLAGFILLLARLLSGYRRWHGALVIGIVLLYLMLIEVHMPVLRAAVMTIAASVGLIFGRRLRVGGLVAFSGILLLLWRPDQLFNAGFQLTYGVVLGLIHLSPPVRRRVFGLPAHSPASTSEMVWEGARTAVVAAVVAWVIATPIAAYHFGMISPLGAPLSVFAVPLSALILALGYLKMLLAAVLPSAALLLGIPLSIGADMLLSIVRAIDELPFSVWHVPYPSAVWALAAVGCACWWALDSGRRTLKWISVAVVVAWLMWPAWFAPAPTLRIDMLAVGDGSCYVVRSAGQTVVFDAGSSTDLAVGRRSLIPALRRLGVRSIDAIAVTHADLDHYSAVVELVDEFEVGEVMVTPQFMAEAQRTPDGPAAHLVDALTRRRVAVETVAAGHSATYGGSHWTWLNPPADRRFEQSNDTSMAVRIECAGRSVLLCGDIEEDAMRLLMQQYAQRIHADVAELPHHGSHHEAAEQFIASVRPKVLMQSTGWARWKRDKWSGKLPGIERLVTARDGACRVEFDDKGNISVGRFLPAGHFVVGP